MQTTFRIAGPSDLPAITACFLQSIQRSCTGNYSPAEIAVWSETAEHSERWLSAIRDQYFLLVEVGESLAGFGTVKDGNYIDFMYLHPDFQGQGIASELLKKLESRALKSGTKVIRSDVSYTARPFFEKHGYTVLHKNENARKGQALVNFSVEKSI